MDRIDCAILIVPVQYVPIGQLIPLQGMQFEHFVQQRLRHWNRNDEANAFEALAQALMDGYVVKHMATNAANATFFLVRGEVDNLLYGQN